MRFASRPLLAAMLALAGCVSDPEPEPPAVPEAEPEVTEPAVREPPVREPEVTEPEVGERPVSEEERAFGEGFLPLTREFGLGEFVSARRTPDGGILYQFLPEDEQLEGWSHLGTVLLGGVGDSWESGQEALPRYTRQVARRVATLHAQEILPGFKGDVYFLHFELAQGDRIEHSLMANWQLLPGLLVSFQVQQRPDPFSPRQVAHFKAIVRQLGRSPAAD